MKKKTIAATLTASLALSALPAVVPLFVPGLAQSAHALSAPLPDETLKNLINTTRNSLSEEDLAAIRKARDNVAQLRADAANNLNLIDEIWGKIEAKIGGSAALYPDVTQEKVLKLILAIGFTYDAEGRHIYESIRDPEMRSTLDQLIKLGGSGGGLNDVGYNDIHAFIDAVKANAKAKIAGMTLDQLLSLAGDKQAAEQLVKDEMQKALGMNNLKFSAVVSAIGISADDIMPAVKRIIAKADPDQAAARAIMIAALRSVLTPPSNGGGGSAPGGGGAPAAPAPAELLNIIRENNGALVRVAVDGTKLAEELGKLAGKPTAEQRFAIEVKEAGDSVKVELPGDALAKAKSSAPQAAITFKFQGASLELPLSALDISALAKELGVDAKDLKLNVSLNKASGATEQQVRDRSKQLGVELLAPPLEFAITAEGGGKSKKVGITNAVAKSVILSGTVNSGRATGAVYDAATGELYFVPSLFSSGGGTTTVRLIRAGDGIYTVIQGNKSFSDMAGHWAKSDVELLANKLVVQGMTQDRFAPDQPITRAEFITLLVRAMGLQQDKNGSTFSDVSGSSWYAGYVGMAKKMGLIDGFEDGTFRPDDSVTREQIAALLARALAIIGKQKEASAGQLARYADSDRIPPWAKDAFAQLLEAGLIQGTTDTTLAPNEQATRAQAAVLLKRTLSYIPYIN